MEKGPAGPPAPFPDPHPYSPLLCSVYGQAILRSVVGQSRDMRSDMNDGFVIRCLYQKCRVSTFCFVANTAKRHVDITRSPVRDFVTEQIVEGGGFASKHVASMAAGSTDPMLVTNSARRRQRLPANARFRRENVAMRAKISILRPWHLGV